VRLIRSQSLLPGKKDSDVITRNLIHFYDSPFKAIDRLNDKLKNFLEKHDASHDEMKNTIAFLSQLQMVLDEASIVSKSDLKGNILYINDTFCSVTGFSRDELIGSHESLLHHPQTPQDVFRDIRYTIQSGQVWKGKVKNLKKSGESFYVDLTIVPIRDESGRIIEYVSMRNDITEIVKSKEELSIMNYVDKLTGYFSRSRLLKDLKRCKKPALAIFNIDNFSELNGFFGNQNGDMVIIALGHALEINFMHYKYEIYRLNGDEYCILDCNNEDSDIFIENMEKAMNLIHFEQITIDYIKLPVRLTVGISFSRENILESANMAVKNARQNTKSLAVYSDEMNMSEKYSQNLTWTHRLKQSIDEERIIPFFQPIVNNKNGKIEKYECLARMIGNEGEIISPVYFLDVAKKAKLYKGLTRSIISRSVSAFKDFDAGFTINLTIEDISDSVSQAHIYSILEENRDAAPRMIFEIVESEGIENFSEIIEFVKNIREMGSKIAIDDFGSGYSNFEYLVRIRPDFIKLDGSLIKNIHTDRNSLCVVESILHFAKRMDIQTVAEYVHSKEVFDIVRKLDIDYSQGFYLGEPLKEIQKSDLAAVFNHNLMGV